MTGTGHTITFTKDGLKAYKALYDEAVSNNHESFVNNGMLIKVIHAKKLIDKLEAAFNQPEAIILNVSQVTIPYEYFF